MLFSRSAALAFLLAFPALADPVGPDEAPEPMREIARGNWDNKEFVATAGHNGETIILRIVQDGVLAVDNGEISNYVPDENSSYKLSTQADGTLLLQIRQTNSYGWLTLKSIVMRGGDGPVQVTNYDVSIGKEGETPDFACKLDLVAGRAGIEIVGNPLASPFQGVPAEQTTAQVWADDTASSIGACINPG